AAGVESAVGQGSVDLQLPAGGRDDLAGVVELELAVAGVGQRAAIADGKEAVAVDGEVEAVAGRFDVTLGELLGDFVDLAAVTDRGRGHTGGRRGEDVAELGARALEAHGLRVRQVVGGDGQVLGRGVQAGQGDIE